MLARRRYQLENHKERDISFFFPRKKFRTLARATFVIMTIIQHYNLHKD